MTERSDKPDAGGYSVTPDELQDLINSWQTLLDSLREDVFTVTGFDRLPSPAGDGASTGQTDATNQSMIALRQAIDAIVGYAKHYLGQLRTAQQRYQEAEHANRDIFRELGAHPR